MTRPTPLVTVIMPAHNAAAYVDAAVASILGQTFRDFRLLAVDDGSTDATAATLQACADPRLTLERLPACRGVAAARNHALDMVDTPYIAFFDADDVAEPDRLMRQIQVLDANPDVGLVASRVAVIDAAGRATGATWGHDRDSAEIRAAMLFANCLATSTVLVRRDVVANERFDGRLNPVDDYDMWLRLLDRARPVCIRQPLVRYRVHGTSLLHLCPDAAENGVRRIAAGLLRRLGLEPACADLDVHRALGRGTPDPSAAGLAATERWLGRLVHANEASGAYATDTFRRVVGLHWLMACEAAALGGSWACSRIARSPLTTAVLADAEGRRGLLRLPWQMARGIRCRRRTRRAPRHALGR